MPRILAILCAAILLAGCGVPPPTGSAVSTPIATPSVDQPSPGATASAAPTSTHAASASPEAGSSTMPTRPPAATPPASTPSPPAATPAPSADRWVRAGRFTAAREDTQLVLVGDGAVLAAGDEPTCGIEAGPSDSAELWLPARGRWTRADVMPSARTLTVLIGLADGRAMVTGGATRDYVAKSDTVVYDPNGRTWSRSGNLDTARMEFAAAPLRGGGVLVAGGLFIGRNQGGRALRSVERWNPRTGRWAEVAPMSSVRQGAAAVTLADGRVLVVGGLEDWGGRPLATAELYDPRTDRWQAAGRLAEPREAFSVVALPDGGALVVGGRSSEDRAERFDPETRSWSRVKGTSPVGERPAAVALADGRVLVVSGRTSRIYDPTSRRWARTAGLPGGMWDASAVLLRDGSVLVGGGWTRPAAEGDTPGCPTYSSRTWRFVPGA